MDRLIKGIRKNDDYRLARALADEFGLSLDVSAPRGRGHPIATFERDGKTAKHHLSTTPGVMDRKRVRHSMLVALRKSGLV